MREEQHGVRIPTTEASSIMTEYTPDPITDDEVAGVPHCGICGQPTGTDHDWSQHGGVADHVAILDGDDDDDPVDDVESDDPDAIFDGLDATEEDLAPAAPGELDDDGTGAETGAVLDDNEDPGQPLPDDPFGPEYATGQA